MTTFNKAANDIRARIIATGDKHLAPIAEMDNAQILRFRELVLNGAAHEARKAPLGELLED